MPWRIFHCLRDAIKPTANRAKPHEAIAAKPPRIASSNSLKLERMMPYVWRLEGFGYAVDSPLLQRRIAFGAAS
jgi:hypothetical protein